MEEYERRGLCLYFFAALKKRRKKTQNDGFPEIKRAASGIGGAGCPGEKIGCDAEALLGPVLRRRNDCRF